MRVVARDGEVVVDESAILPGRGAWVHPTRSCIESAIARRAFGRALKVEATLSTGQILNCAD
jgi:Predicted nucleic-acid-binding protein implicated in transcription termination